MFDVRTLILNLLVVYNQRSYHPYGSFELLLQNFDWLHCVLVIFPLFMPFWTTEGEEEQSKGELLM